MGLFITFILGGFILIGAGISHATRENQTIVQWSVALALGTLAALMVVELIPEAAEHLGSGNWYLVVFGAVIGLAGLMILDRFLPDHDAMHGEGHGRHHGHGHDHASHYAAHIGIISAIAVTLHNMIEGMAVYSIADQSVAAGLMIAIGVGLHNIPMGMVIAATLKNNKRDQRNMLLLASLSTFIGGLMMALLTNVIGEDVVGILLSVTLGMIIYIIFFELLPMVLHEKRWNITVPGVAAGVVLILISTLFE